ncbi:MAG: DUF4258 domain-containing protein [Acidithiobacillus sp.]
MHSSRFDRAVILTHHARSRMQERGVTDAELLAIIENGTVRAKDERRIWIYREFAGRQDNLLCVAALLEDALIVKTIMTHWEVSP